jgi:hypothetical protein
MVMIRLVHRGTRQEIKGVASSRLIGRLSGRLGGRLIGRPGGWLGRSVNLGC